MITLLKILGKGKVQRNAVDQLLALPDANEYEELAEALLDFSAIPDLEQWLRNRPELL